MPAMVMFHEKDPKDVILDAIGDLSGIEVAKNQFILAVYERPQMTKSSILLPDSVREEDKFQGKVGLIVKLGPDAFVDDEKWHFTLKGAVGDWIVIRASDGWACTINGKLCRMADDTDLRLRIQHPDQVW